ncbi:hypothetical protein [Azospirillum sp.]|uniref:hypothetical protein n=1 Tax=Azospirillum sp. TaxID=34012 RepID=UPI00262729C3|nr:hypothetical protein [Azospirillum sp.]
MALELSGADHDALDNLLGRVLDLQAANRVSREASVSLLAHILTAAAIDNAGEVQSWLHIPRVVEEWEKRANA